MFSTLARCQSQLAGSAARQFMLQRIAFPVPFHKSHRTQRCYSVAPPPGNPAYGTASQYSQYQDTSNYTPSGDYQNQGYGTQDRSDRRYISWNVYKSKSALAVRLIRPKYAQNSDGSFRVEREGELRLEFAQVLQSGPQEAEGFGNRKFDWANKQVFHLSATELATIVEDPLTPHQFYHDPRKGTPEENTIGKNLKWNVPSNPNDAKANWYMNLTVTNRGQPPLNYSIGLTKGELAVLKNLAPNLIWHMLGFSEVTIP